MKKKHDTGEVTGESPAAAKARQWVMRTRCGSTPPEAEAELDDWLRADPDHKQEFDLMSAIWEHTDVLKDHPMVLKTLNHRTGGAMAWLQNFLAGFQSLRPVATAAAVLLAVACIWLVQSLMTAHQTFQTATGEQTIVHLKDGSKVALDSETVITAKITRSKRQIELKIGRAIFSVAHDRKRPFVVTAGHVSVRALGTEFKVSKKHADRISVAVLSGSVQINRTPYYAAVNNVETMIRVETHSRQQQQISSAEMNPAHAEKIIASQPKPAARPTVQAQAVLDAGQEITVYAKEADYHVTSVDIEYMDTWRRGRLYFRNAALEDVVDEINRYLDRKLVLGDELLRDLRISIIFNIKDRNHFVTTLEKTIPIIAQYTSNNKITLVSSTTPQCCVN
ncbi:MAG: DUF4880 domain-containing protein [Desulfobacteraceae bacterium]|nr:DUF4880 domain-containing protein [Desulfobacteraceae bacterium]